MLDGLACEQSWQSGSMSACVKTHIAPRCVSNPCWSNCLTRSSAKLCLASKDARGHPGSAANARDTVINTTSAIALLPTSRTGDIQPTKRAWTWTWRTRKCASRVRRGGKCTSEFDRDQSGIVRSRSATKSSILGVGRGVDEEFDASRNKRSRSD